MDENRQNYQKLANQIALEQKTYTQAKIDLLIIIAFTLINIILLIAGGDTYMLFSAYIPYMLVVYGYFYAGRADASMYEDVQNFEPQGDGLLIVTVAVALLILAAYLILALMSKKHYGYMLAAAVLFTVDTLFILGSFDILSMAIHVVMLIVIARGVFVGKKLFDNIEKLEVLKSEGLAPAEAVQEPEQPTDTADTSNNE